MAKIKPFKGYTPRKGLSAEELPKRVAPPYDVISPELERELKEHEFNITHVTLGDKEGKYAGAAKKLREWIASTELQQCEHPAVYVYAQTFDTPKGRKTRTGFVSLVQIEEFEKKVILPHEFTLPKHKEDRYLFLNATNAHVGHIFAVYDDEKGEVDGILEKNKTNENLLLDFAARDGVRHQLWKIISKADIEAIQKKMHYTKLFIADGHHRYEVALQYRNDMRKKTRKNSGEEDFDYRLMTLVNMSNEGLVVFPTHRIVFGVDEGKIGGLAGTLEKNFSIRKCTSQSELVEFVENGPVHTIGFYDKKNGAFFAASLKDVKTMDERIGKDNPTKDLDVTILHSLVLEDALGITKQMQDAKTNLDYVKGTKETFEEMKKEEKYQLACILRATSVQEVKKVAEKLERMPQKSTFFYPKVWDGLVLNLMKV
ncbi:DUF1015 domain-containing protein [Candidatus Micrarchaeota archaeon]|nr:DUF1015 domain-containing protein [Candidatus Micrarchaeota archaeon]